MCPLKIHSKIIIQIECAVGLKEHFLHVEGELNVPVSTFFYELSILDNECDFWKNLIFI